MRSFVKSAVAVVLFVGFSMELKAQVPAPPPPKGGAGLPVITAPIPARADPVVFDALQDARQRLAEINAALLEAKAEWKLAQEVQVEIDKAEEVVQAATKTALVIIDGYGLKSDLT